MFCLNFFAGAVPAFFLSFFGGLCIVLCGICVCGCCMKMIFVSRWWWQRIKNTINVLGCFVDIVLCIRMVKIMLV